VSDVTPKAVLEVPSEIKDNLFTLMLLQPVWLSFLCMSFFSKHAHDFFVYTMKVNGVQNVTTIKTFFQNFGRIKKVKQV